METTAEYILGKYTKKELREKIAKVRQQYQTIAVRKIYCPVWDEWIQNQYIHAYHITKPYQKVFVSVDCQHCGHKHKNYLVGAWEIQQEVDYLSENLPLTYI